MVPGSSLKCARTSRCVLPLPQCLQLLRVSLLLFCRTSLTSAHQSFRRLCGKNKSSNTERLEIFMCTSKRFFGLTWSLNMREIISNTCILHCCSLWADARNLTRSSKPLMWMAHSSRSWMLASSSTFYRKRQTGEIKGYRIDLALPLLIHVKVRPSLHRGPQVHEGHS